MSAGSIAPRPQLLTYPDGLGGRLRDIEALLAGPLDGLFRGVHILPPYPSSGDRGFAPTSYSRIDARFGGWDDIRRLARRHDVLLDVMVNHLSRRSREFRDFERRGRKSPYADLFITLDKVWPNGDPPAADVARIFLRKPDSPFSAIPIRESGRVETVWTTFGTGGQSEQVDLDVHSPATRSMFASWLRSIASGGVRIVRLDAIGYVIKKPGTSCFMVTPEIFEFMAWISALAAEHGMVVLPEIHDRQETHRQLARRGFWTYDFVLPALVLDAFESGDGARLGAHLADSPERQFTTLDCHDGIPIRPDLDGILDPAAMARLATVVSDRGGNVNRILSDVHAADGDVHQLNCTYYSALGEDDERYFAARAIQLFARGVPQVYYVGLLAGRNDPAEVGRTGDGRAINRHNFTMDEVAGALERPLVRRILDLVRLRNTHPAFDGALTVEAHGSRLRMAWEAPGSRCALRVDLAGGEAVIEDDGPAPSPRLAEAQPQAAT